MSQLLINKTAFERFWDTYLGENWYVEEGPYPSEDDHETEMFDINDTWIVWQGDDPEDASEIVKKADIGGGVRLSVLYRRWAKSLGSGGEVVVLASFRVPGDRANDIRERIKAMGGEIL